MRPKGTASELEVRRRLAGRMLEAGHSQAEIARLVDVTPASVTRWKNAFQRKGLAGLQAKPRLGAKPKLTKPQMNQLPHLLLRGARDWGYQTDLWTLPRIAKVIGKHFGVKYHHRYLWYLMRKLGWSCQKPKRRAAQQDQQAVQAWVQKKWPGIKKSPQSA